MKDIPKVGFVCAGESALELSSAICCAGKLMRYFTDKGYMTGGCYSCISPSKQIKLLRERICHMCACNDLVVTVGCDGFRNSDVMPDIVTSLCHRDLPYFSHKLSADEYRDRESGKIFKCFPSRGTAGIYSSAIIVCVSTDPPSAAGKLDSLMPSIEFALGTASRKKPAKSLELEDLVSEFYLERSFQD